MPITFAEEGVAQNARKKCQDPLGKFSQKEKEKYREEHPGCTVVLLRTTSSLRISLLVSSIKLTIPGGMTIIEGGRLG